MPSKQLGLSGVEVALLGAALLATLYIQFLLWPHFTDDAYITLRYAERLLDGQGLTFNNGERVEGFSNPLWLLMVAAGSWLSGLGLVLTAKSLGLLLMFGTLGAITSIARSVGGKLLLPLAICFLLAMPGIQIYARLGMEVPLLMCLLTVGVALSLKAGPQNVWATLGAACCFSLVAITRPEGALYTALWGLAFAGWWFVSHKTQRLGLLVLAGVISVIPFAAYEMFRLHYYGSWVPNTALAKPPGIWGYRSLWAEWLPYLSIGLFLSLFAALKRPVLTGSHIKLLSLSGAVIAAGVIFSVYSGADWMDFGRFILPIWPLMLIVLLLPVAQWLEPQRRILAVALVFLAGATGLLWAAPYMRNEKLAPMLMRGSDQVVVGKWLAETFPYPLRVATGRLGGVSYYAPQHTFWDFFGLTDAQQARAIYASWPDASTILLNSKNLVLRRKPDVVLVYRSPVAVGAPLYTAQELTALQSYTCVRQFPQGNWGTYDVWVTAPLTLAAKGSCSL